MFVGAISFVEEGSNLITEVVSGLSALPAWLLIAAGVYVGLQIIHLVIYRDLRRVVIYNVMMTLFLTIITLITDRELVKMIQVSNVFTEDSFMSARLIEYIILVVILFFGSVYTLVYMISHRDGLPKKGQKKPKLLDSRPIYRSDKIMMTLNGVLLAMAVMLLAFTNSGARISVDIIDREQETLFTRERYTLPVKLGERLMLGDYQVSVEEWDADGVEIKADQRIKKETDEKLHWNTRYRIEDDSLSGVKRYQCSIKFSQ